MSQGIPRCNSKAPTAPLRFGDYVGCDSSDLRARSDFTLGITQRPIISAGVASIDRLLDWSYVWRIREIITAARHTRIPAILAPINTRELDTEILLAVTRYTAGVIKRTGIPCTGIMQVPSSVELVSHVLSGTRAPPTFYRAASAHLNGLIVLYRGDIVWLARRKNGQGLYRTDRMLLAAVLKASIAHELVHLEHMNGIPQRLKRLVTVYMAAHGGAEPPLEVLDELTSIARLQKYYLLRHRRLTQTAGDVASLQHWFGTRPDEEMALSVDALVGNPNATTYSIRPYHVYPNDDSALAQAMGGVDEKRPIRMDLRDPESYAGRYLEPTRSARALRVLYNASNSRPVMAFFRGAGLASGLFSGLDFIVAVNSFKDPSQDKVDTTINWGVATASSTSSAVLVYDILGRDPAKLAVLVGTRGASFAGIVGGAATVLVGTRHVYDDFRDFGETSAAEKTFSITETLGAGAATVGAVLLAYGTGGLAVPLLLLFGGSSVSVGSQIGRGEAKEARVARRVAQALVARDYKALVRFSIDERGDFDDDAAVELFEDYLIPKKLLSSDLWCSESLRPLRQKLIKELGGEGFFSYMGDEEAAYRLFVALHESTTEAKRIAEQMDSSDWEEFESFVAKNHVNVNLPEDVKSIRSNK